MKQLIESTINWNKIGKHPKSDYHFSIGRAILSRDQSTLTIEICLNFVMPYSDVLRLLALVKNQAPGLENVAFRFIYEDVILSPEEIIRLYIEHMIAEANGTYSKYTKTIVNEEFSYKKANDVAAASNPEGARATLTLYTLGEVAAENLNQAVSAKFSEYLARDFGIYANVAFVNHEDRSRIAAEQQADEEKKALAEMAKMQEEAARVYKERVAAGEINPDKGGYGQGNFGGYAQGSRGGQGAWNQGNQAAFGGYPAGGKGGWKRKDKYIPVEGNVIMGRAIAGEATALSQLSPESGNVIVEGVIFKKESKETKNGSILATILITDNKTSACVKAFMLPQKWEDVETHLPEGSFVRIRGEAQLDKFEQVLVVMGRDIEKVPGRAAKPPREDKCAFGKRVELHAHTKMSAMDGLNEAADIVKKAAMWGQPAVAITDHGVVQSFPDAAKTAKNLKKSKDIDIKIIYGMEGYVYDETGHVDSEGNIDYKAGPTNHIILLAKTQEGIKNIYKLVSISHLNYFYKRPRLPKSVIEAHREGLIIGSACEAGEVYRAILNGKSEEEIERIADFYDYLEIQPLINNRFLIENGTVPDYEALKEINRKIIALADKQGKLVVATTDAHYGEPEEALYRNILMAGQGYKDAENGQGLYLRTTDEMLEEFSYLGEELAKKVVIENTNKIADMIGELLPVPKGKFPPKIEGAEETLRTTCMEKAYSIYGNPLPEPILERLEKELNSIIGNGYAVMYVSAQMLVNKSLSDGYLVGSRGSVGSSFAATMAGITEVNPLPPHYICPKCKKLLWGAELYGDGEYDCGVDMPDKSCPECGEEMTKEGHTIPFETFLGFNGDKEPDIDLNFAGEYQPVAHRYVGEIFGEKNVFKAGTVGTVAEKTAFGFVKKYYEERQIPVNKFEIERLAHCCTGVKRTTGQHPGGIIIVPDDHEIYEFCPVQHPANDVTSDIVTTHFDYHKIDENLLKLDILGHDIPSMLRHLWDMTGRDPLTVPFGDKDVMSLFTGIEALKIKDPEYKFVHGSYGIPEFGTSFTRQMLDDTKPTKFADLVRIAGFSHGTDVWTGNAQEFIRSGQATMKEAISTRDDIMNFLILKGLPNQNSFKIMEGVRKGKGLTEEQEALMIEHNVPEWYIESCKRIKYMFPRAHAVAYVMMSYRMAWYKVHYPVEFYATYFTTKVSEFDAETMLKGKQAVVDKMNMLRDKGYNATKKEEDEIIVLEVAYEMYSRGYEFTSARLGKSDAVRFMTSEEDGVKKVLLPFVALTGVGETAARALASEYEKGAFSTIEEATDRARLNKTAIEALKAHDVFKGLPETDQLDFFSLLGA